MVAMKWHGRRWHCPLWAIWENFVVNSELYLIIPPIRIVPNSNVNHCIEKRRSITLPPAICSLLDLSSAALDGSKGVGKSSNRHSDGNTLYNRHFGCRWRSSGARTSRTSPIWKEQSKCKECREYIKTLHSNRHFRIPWHFSLTLVMKPIQRKRCTLEQRQDWIQLECSWIPRAPRECPHQELWNEPEELWN